MSRKTLLCTGAAGFIGNAVCRRFRDRYAVLAVDDLSSPTAKPPAGVQFYPMDAARFLAGLEKIDVVIHLAAQVSVTGSLDDPINDFRRNAELTFRVAEWASRCRPRPVVIYASTNKVFGELTGRRLPVPDMWWENPQTPYGVSKATGGWYIRDFLPQTGYVFHQSCIYGHDQIGTPDQGWIGFLRRSIADQIPITCYGDGEQIRDLLHVEDLLDAYELAIAGKIPPGSLIAGGGCANAVSFREAVLRLGGTIARFLPPRLHDQQYFVAESDTLRGAGWRPQIAARAWLDSSRSV